MSTIHDLGYKRYVGTRLAASRRWRVIARHQIAMAWKGFWRFKAWLGIAVLTTVVAGAVMYILSNKIFHGMGRGGEMVLTFRDIALPMSIQWYCRAAFFVSLTITATVIAGDQQSGAFTFYFARSVRPRDYVVGKLAGIAFLMIVITAFGPFLLAALRLGLSDDWSALAADWMILPKALAVGALTTVAYTAIPLGISALASTRRSALAIWAAFYLIGGYMLTGIGLGTHTGWIAALDFTTAIEAIGFKLLFTSNLASMFTGRMGEVPLDTALISVLAQSAAAVAILWVQLGKTHHAGVGAS